MCTIALEPPLFPTDLHIGTIHNGSYSANLELLWGSNGVQNGTHLAISVSSNGETWTSTAPVEVGRASITLSYNTNYTLDVVATNCAGRSIGISVTDIIIGMYAVSSKIVHGAYILILYYTIIQPIAHLL